MKYVRVIRLHICRVEKFTVLNNEAITWVITPVLSELLTRNYRSYGVIRSYPG